MPYATLTDVQNRMPQFVLSPVSKPNLDTAQIYLDDCHAQFDAALENMGYTVPITGAGALAQCKEIVVLGTIYRILYARGAAVGTDAAFQSAKIFKEQYDEALLSLKDPDSPIELVGAERTSDQVTKPGIEPLGLTHDDSGDLIEPRVTMDMRF